MRQKIFLLLIVISLAVSSYAQRSEVAAIKKLLEKESATWQAGDKKAHAACWAIKPYSRILYSAGDGTTIDIPPSMMINPPADMMGDGGTSVNTNYKMNISGNNAWVSHNETSTARDGAKTYTYEFRILEKIKGQWKLVGQSIHTYKPQ